jgi:predicted Rossmann-fold nucleotide-binding protein
MNKICSICLGSKNNDKYENLIHETILYLKDKNYEIKYGGSNVGLMGKLYDFCKLHNVKITGIIPDIFDNLVTKEMKEDMITTTAPYPENFKNRQTDIIFNTNLTIFLPGGIGTIYELLERAVFNQISKYTKEKKIDIVLINKEFYNFFIDMIVYLEKNSFLDENPLEHLNIYVVDHISEYFDIKK